MRRREKKRSLFLQALKEEKDQTKGAVVAKKRGAKSSGHSTPRGKSEESAAVPREGQREEKR